MSKTESPSLVLLMEKGYNVQMECKAKGRTYEMTFEATAKRIMQPGENYNDWLLQNYGTWLHAVGDTIEETAHRLLIKVEQAEEGLDDNR